MCKTDKQKKKNMFLRTVRRWVISNRRQSLLFMPQCKNIKPREAHPWRGQSRFSACVPNWKPQLLPQSVSTGWFEVLNSMMLSIWCYLLFLGSFAQGGILLSLWLSWSRHPANCLNGMFLVHFFSMFIILLLDFFSFALSIGLLPSSPLDVLSTWLDDVLWSSYRSLCCSLFCSCAFTCSLCNQRNHLNLKALLL